MERGGNHPAGTVKVNGPLMGVHDERAAAATYEANIQGSLRHGFTSFGSPFQATGQTNVFQTSGVGHDSRKWPLRQRFGFPEGRIRQPEGPGLKSLNPPAIRDAARPR
jgi:hypothetical protein